MGFARCGCGNVARPSESSLTRSGWGVMGTCCMLHGWTGAADWIEAPGHATAHAWSGLPLLDALRDPFTVWRCEWIMLEIGSGTCTIVAALLGAWVGGVAMQDGGERMQLGECSSGGDWDERDILVSV